MTSDHMIMASPSQPESVPQDLASSQSPDLFRQVSAYPFSSDREFQQGLRAILDSASSPEETDALTLDAQCFYYARCVISAPLENKWATRIPSSIVTYIPDPGNTPFPAWTLTPIEPGCNPSPLTMRRPRL